METKSSILTELRILSKQDFIDWLDGRHFWVIFSCSFTKVVMGTDLGLVVLKVSHKEKHYAKKKCCVGPSDGGKTPAPGY